MPSEESKTVKRFGIQKIKESKIQLLEDLRNLPDYGTDCCPTNAKQAAASLQMIAQNNKIEKLRRILI